MLRIVFLMGYLLGTVYAFHDYVYYPEVRESYKFVRTPKNWFDAMETCRGNNGALALPKNEAEVEVLKKIFKGYPAQVLKNVANPDYFYLGFHDMFKKWEFVTVDGIPLQYYYRKWDVFKANHKSNEHCITINRSGLLNNVPCNTTAIFVCQKKNKKAKISKVKECITEDTEYKFFEPSNKFFKLHLNPQTWREARTICQTEGGNMAIINNKAEEDFLVALFNKTENFLSYNQVNDHVLIGIHHLFRESFFFTVKGDELQSTGYTNWYSVEPNNLGGNERCGSMYLSGHINDFPCDLPSVFFCEIEIESNKNSSTQIGNWGSTQLDYRF